MADAPLPFELFHELADPKSARVRRYVTEHGLKPQVAFRNVTYPEALAALKAHGGETVPALWDGVTLFSGADAILARLARAR